MKAMKSIARSKRVGEIEFLRFVFAVIVILRHSSYMFDNKRLLFPGGAFAVEFFLLVSGYLFMASMERLKDKPIESLAKETGVFVWRKISPIYLEIFLSFVIGFAVQCVAKAMSPKEAGLLFINSIPEMLLLQITGFGKLRVNSVIWYIEAMLLCFVILYPLVRRFPDMMKRIVMPVASLVLLGFLLINYNSFRDPLKWLGFSYKGVIRAMGVICLGAVCYSITEKLKGYDFTLFGKLVLTIVKWSSFTALIVYMLLDTTSYDGVFLLVMAVAIILAFSRQCIDTTIFQNKLCITLGAWSLPIYLNHIYFARYLTYLLPDITSQKVLLAIYFAALILSSALVVILSKGLRKLWPSIKSGLGKLILRKGA